MEFELVAGPYAGPTGGVVWDGAAVLFTAIDEGRLLRFDPQTREVDEVRRHLNRVNGLAFGPAHANCTAHRKADGAWWNSRRTVGWSRSTRCSTASTTISR